MRKLKYNIIITFCLIIVAFCLSNATIKAEVSDTSKLYDNAGLLSDSEAEEISNSLDEVSSKYDCDVAIITTDNINGYYSRDDYMKAFAEEYNLSDDYVIMLVNMDNTSRGLSISSNHKCHENINDNVCDRIYESIRSDMSNGEYYLAFQAYCKQVNKYLSPYGKFYRAFDAKEIAISLLIAFVIGGVAVFIMVHNAGGKDTTNAITYMNAGNSRILVQRDQYIRTSLTRVKIQHDDNHGGGGHGGGGHGGGGHSSGGGSF